MSRWCSHGSLAQALLVDDTSAMTDQAGACAGTEPRVGLSGLGELVGDNVSGVARFLSVPYAAPPTGPLRWKPPQPASPWSEARANPPSLPRCPQLSPKELTFKGYNVVESEDCLVLNVWTPASSLPSMNQGGESADLLPVIVYIHGGGGKFGSAHIRSLSGLRLAQRNQVCCIAPNYRLGIFGFLAHPELSLEDENCAQQPGDRCSQVGSGNYALLDLVASLRWVQRYAPQFGGDPARVTIWGLSSGAQYVASLLVCPSAQGLFHRAMIQSCVDISTIRKLRSSCDIWLGKSAEDWGSELGESMGCPKGEGQLAKMRELSAAKIARHSVREPANDCYEPTIDRRCFGSDASQALCSAKPMSSLEALVAGKFHRVPVMLGYTAHDGLGKEELEHTLFRASDVTDRQGLSLLMEREFGSDKDKALALYGKLIKSKACLSESAEVERILASFSNDLWYYAATWHMADLLVKASSPSPVFLYVFGALSRHSKHGFDSSFWRGAEQSPISSLMAEYLANFARTGNPNAEGLPIWDGHVAGTDRIMELSRTTPTMIERSEDERRRHELVINQYFSKRLLSEARRGEHGLAPPFQDGTPAGNCLEEAGPSVKRKVEDSETEHTAKKQRQE